MYETRHRFREDLEELELQTLGGIDLVLAQLDGALESVIAQDVDLAAAVTADDDRVDGRYLEVQQGVLSLLVRQAPVAGDLRLIAALLHIIRCVERMGDQCVNIAKLVPLTVTHAPSDAGILKAVERMGQIARRQVADAREAFKTRHVTLARSLDEHGAAIGRLNREIFNRALELGDDVTVREPAMFMILVARALERIADNAAEIAGQTEFVVTGVLRASPGGPQPA